MPRPLPPPRPSARSPPGLVVVDAGEAGRGVWPSSQTASPPSLAEATWPPSSRSPPCATRGAARSRCPAGVSAKTPSSRRMARRSRFCVPLRPRSTLELARAGGGVGGEQLQLVAAGQGERARVHVEARAVAALGARRVVLDVGGRGAADLHLHAERAEVLARSALTVRSEARAAGAASRRPRPREHAQAASAGVGRKRS